MESAIPAESSGGDERGDGLLSAFHKEHPQRPSSANTKAPADGGMGGEEMKASLGEKDHHSTSSPDYPPMGRQISTDTYDIGSTHFPTYFWGLMTMLTLLGAFLIVSAIIVLNIFEVSYGGVQLALKGQTIDTNLNILSPAGDATIHLRPGVAWEDAFVIAAELRGQLAVYHGREALEPVLELGSDGSLSNAGDTHVGGQVAARGFSSGTQGVTFADGSTMTTAASKLTGTSSETDLNLIAGSKGGSGAIIMSTGLEERVRVDGSGKVFFRGHDANGAVAGLGAGVLIDGANATVIFGEQLTLTPDGISSLADVVLDSTGSIVLGSSPSAVTAVRGSFRVEEHSSVEIGSDKASFTVSAQSYAESVVTYLPGGSSSSLATLNATSQGVPQVSPSTAGLVWNSQEACESGEVCVGYAGSAPRWAAVSLALEGVRLEQKASDAVNTNGTALPAMAWVLCRVEGSNGDGVLDVSGAVAVSNDPDYFSGLGMTRHALLEPGTRYVIRCGTKNASGGPFLCDRVSLSMVAL